MLLEYFVDAWYFIARANPFDGHHDAARRLERFVERHKLVTHDGVLSEVLAYFSGAGASDRERAVEMVRRALRDFAVDPADRQLFGRGLDLYGRRPDKEYSLTDCVSMVIMRERGITHVLTNDHHFGEEGFTVLSDAP